MFLVCSWWSSIPLHEKYSPKSQIPWLMFSPKAKINSRYMYSMTEKKLYEFNLPSIAGQRCHGSSHGYLLSVDANADLVATNPLAPESRIPLPPTSSFFDSVVHDSSGRITDYVTFDCYTYKTWYKTSYVIDEYYGKVILSPDRKTVVAHIWLDDSRGFTCIGDEGWKPLYIVGGLEDFIFHQGHLCAVTSTGKLFIYDLSRGSKKPYESVEWPIPGYTDFGEYDFPRAYLVESPCKVNLFLVFRFSKWVEHQEETCKFKVFMLDQAATTITWKRIYTLEDISFFLGFNYSMALCARDLPGLKKNCIYFTNDTLANPEAVGDSGVFSFDDGTIKWLYEDNNLDQSKWLQPVWFMPNVL